MSLKMRLEQARPALTLEERDDGKIAIIMEFAEFEQVKWAGREDGPAFVRSPAPGEILGKDGQPIGAAGPQSIEVKVAELQIVWSPNMLRGFASAITAACDNADLAQVNLLGAGPNGGSEA